MSGARASDAGPADVDLSRVWLGVAAQVWRREPGWLERLARRLLRSLGLARALVTTPSLLLGWVIATVAVLGAGRRPPRGPARRSWPCSRPRSREPASPTPTARASTRPGN